MAKRNTNININQGALLFPDMEHTFADFFCGCGGLSLGFIQAGLKCVSAMDIAPEAIATYWYNLCYKDWSHLWIPEDVGEKQLKKLRKYLGEGKTNNYLFKNGVPDNWLSVKEPMPCLNLFLWSILDLEPEEWMDIIGVRPGDIRIFAGGPPCQGFSTANTSRSIYDSKNQLPLRYIHYAKVCKPDIVFMENVPGLLSLGKKKGEKVGPFVHWIMNAFEEAGYDMDYGVHDAADYGVPQRRKRVIFVAFRKGSEFRFKMPEPLYGEGKIPYITTLEAIGDLPPLQSGEQWGIKATSRGVNAMLHPYGYNKREGYVICPACFKYNKQEREVCHNCSQELTNPIKGGILNFPGLGTLIDTQKDIDNSMLRKHFNLL